MESDDSNDQMWKVTISIPGYEVDLWFCAKETFFMDEIFGKMVVLMLLPLEDKESYYLMKLIQLNLDLLILSYEQSCGYMISMGTEIDFRVFLFNFRCSV